MVVLRQVFLRKYAQGWQSHGAFPTPATPTLKLMLINNLDEVYSLSDWIIQKASEEDSVWAKFLELFTVEFILDNLDERSQKQFLQMIGDGDKNAVDFACGRIKDFSNKYARALSDRILKMIEEKEAHD